MTFVGDVLDVTGIPRKTEDAAFYSGAVAGALCFRHSRMMSPADPSSWDGPFWGWCSRNRKCRRWVPFGIQATSRPNPGWRAEPCRLFKAGLALLLEVLNFVIKTGISGCGSGFIWDEVSSFGPPLPESPSESGGLPASYSTMSGRDRTSSFPDGQGEYEREGELFF